jgi:hypothetical protein
MGRYTTLPTGAITSEGVAGKLGWLFYYWDGGRSGMVFIYG